MPCRNPTTVAILLSLPTAADCTDVCEHVVVQRKTALFVATDAIALVLFAVIGLTSHHRGIGLHGLTRDALPVLLGWFVVASVAGTYRRPSWPRFIATWIAGVS